MYTNNHYKVKQSQAEVPKATITYKPLDLILQYEECEWSKHFEALEDVDKSFPESEECSQDSHQV